jgi:thymidylate kinase
VTTVALIGPDGAGKTTVAEALDGRVSRPVRTLYMGVSAGSSNVVLPTTRVARALKRRLGAPPDTAGPRAHRPGGSDGSGEREGSSTGSAGRRGGIRRLPAHARTALRVANRIAEEWYRAVVARRWEREGAVVIFDRHYFADYHAYDLAPGERTLSQRVHAFSLRHLPRPDLVVYLDAPGSVLLARKGEGTVEVLEARRADYRAIAGLVPRFIEIDATQPLDAVIDQVAAAIEARLDADGGPRP